MTLHLVFTSHQPAAQVAVGDIVRVENKRIFPADMLLLSSRYIGGCITLFCTSIKMERGSLFVCSSDVSCSHLGV